MVGDRRWEVIGRIGQRWIGGECVEDGLVDDGQVHLIVLQAGQSPPSFFLWFCRVPSLWN